MAYFIVEDFRLGQDSRKSTLTAPPGTLTTLVNGHITRGGEIEKRKALVSTYTIPSGTYGLAAAEGALYVFGSGTDPGVPSGITYQRLQHPSASAMTSVSYVELFDGLLYVAAVFADGSTQHFYDGTLIDDFADGIARGSFNITGGSASGQAATGSFTITGGTSNPGTNKVATVPINGVDVLGAAVDWVTSNTATATAVAAQIATYTSSPNYTASANGAVVTITASVSGTTPNGLVIAPTVGGDVTVGSIVNMAGGTDQNQITSVKVNGVEVLSTAVSWTTSNSATATAVAAQITSYASSPDYTATASGERVIISAPAAGTAYNNFVVGTTVTGTFTVGSVVNMQNGLESASTITPGSSVLTFGTKTYTISGSRLVFSAVNDPTDYNDVTGIGAGSINLSNFSAGSATLTGLGVFYDKAAVFSDDVIQLWTLDADDDNNALAQVIRNAGTRCPRSISSFGNGDLLYLDNSGYRSIRARDSNNIGQAVDVGNPIDDAVLEHRATLTEAQITRSVSVVEPQDKRYWSALGEKVFVYSYFPGSQISAWGSYSFPDDDDEAMEITDFAVLSRRVYARVGDVVYLYGGSDDATYEACETVFVIPYLDGKSPGTPKQLLGIDIVAEGTWLIQMACNPDRPDDWEDIGTFTGSTLHKESIPVEGRSTYFAFKFTHERAEYARFSRFLMHFEKDNAKPASAG